MRLFKISPSTVVTAGLLVLAGLLGACDPEAPSSKKPSAVVLKASDVSEAAADMKLPSIASKQLTIRDSYSAQGNFLVLTTPGVSPPAGLERIERATGRYAALIGSTYEVALTRSNQTVTVKVRLGLRDYSQRWLVYATTEEVQAVLADLKISQQAPAVTAIAGKIYVASFVSVASTNKLEIGPSPVSGTERDTYTELCQNLVEVWLVEGEAAKLKSPVWKDQLGNVQTMAQEVTCNADAAAMAAARAGATYQQYADGIKQRASRTFTGSGGIAAHPQVVNEATFNKLK